MWIVVSRSGGLPNSFRVDRFSLSAKQLSGAVRRRFSTQSRCSSANAQPLERTYSINDTITKSANDTSNYRYIELKNKIKILLISDASTEKASAAVDVNVGHQCDPDDIPGIAHFCEHMLFMGTEKYPVENDFTQYLSEHGGMSNAYTSGEHTNYHFDVRAEALPGALDRFAQFFVSPLFDRNSKDRELLAIESEHQKNINTDARRIDRVDRLTCTDGHVWRKFGTGNLDTLKTIPESRGIDIREELLKFHQKWYSSNIMTAAVVGKESLDELEEMVVPLFEGVVNKDVTPPSYDTHPFEDKLQLETNVVTVREMRMLNLRFPIPDFSEQYDAKPSHYLMHFLGHEGKGSLLSLLKKKGWVNRLYAGPMHGAKGFSFFDIGLEMTEQGIEHIDEIVTHVFQYIKLISSGEPQQWVFDEMKMLDNIKFQFKDKSQPINYSTGLAENMQEYSADDTLYGGYALRSWRPDLIQQVMDHLKPENMRMCVSSQQFEDTADKVDDYYGVKYSVKKISEENIHHWSRVDLHSELELPAPNPFIPENLDVVGTKHAHGEKPAYPTLIKDEDMMRIWYKQDDTFLLPKSKLKIMIRSPFSYTSPFHAMCQSMYVALVKDALVEFAYDAELAGISYGVSGTGGGIQIGIGGYNDKQAILLDQILNKISNLKISKDRLEIFKEEFRQSIANMEAQQPYQTVQQVKQYILEEVVWQPEELLKVLPDINVDSLAAYKDLFLNQIHIEALLMGNIKEQDANDVTQLLERTFKDETNSKSMSLLHHNNRREYILDEGTNYLYEKKNKIHDMSCIQVYLQFGEQSTQSNVMSELVAQCIREQCFDTLRTKHQLGYIVFSGLYRSSACQGLLLLVQSDHTPQEVEQKIESFLEEFQDTLINMPEEEFHNHVEALVLQKLEKPKKLSSEASRYWSEIMCKQYHFNRAEVEVEELRTKTKEDVIQFYKTLVSPSSEKRKKLATIVLGKEAQSIDKQDNKWQTISDILRFKYSHPLSRLVSPYMDIPIVNTTNGEQ